MLTASVIDAFDSGTLGAQWSGSYGDPTVVAGRVRVPCTTGYTGCATAASYTLAGSHLLAEVYGPAAGGAVSEALAEMLVLSSVGGVDAGFSLNMASGQLRLYNRSGYFDGSAVTLTYSAAAHRWWRLRESGGSLFWETAPDGGTWTVRRTAVSPAWVGDTNLTILLAAHRDAGTADYAEFDNVNNPSGYAAAGTSAVARAAAGAAAVAYAKAGA